MNLIIIPLIFIHNFLFSQLYAQDISQYKKMIEEALKAQDSSGVDVDIRIERVTGDVKVVSQDGEEISLTDSYQYPLEIGDIIKTGYNGGANIYIDNFGIIRLDRNSEFEVSDTSNDMIFTLNFGAIISKIEKLAKKMTLKVKTPAAVCGIRGTEFAIEVSKLGGESSFGVFDEGEIHVYPGEEENEQQVLKVLKNMEVMIDPKSKRQKIVKIQRMLKFKRYIIESKNKLITHKRNWKKFDLMQRQKYRELLFKRKTYQEKNRIKSNIKSQRKKIKK
ncbi:MAG: FecR family protein [Elusimicrobiota bacterium]